MTPDVAIAAKFASRLALRAIHLASLHGRLVAPMGAEQGGTLNWKMDHVPVKWRFDEGLLKVIVVFELAITFEHEGVEKKVVELGAIFRLDYERHPELTVSDEELGHFSGVHGIMHSWPYFRSEVQALTSKMEIPPLTLPVLLSGMIGPLVSVEMLPLVEEASQVMPNAPERSPKLQRAGLKRRRKRAS